MAGATKAEAAATRREKRKKVRILIVLLDKVVVNGLCVMVSEEHNSDEVEGPEDRQAAAGYGGISIKVAKYVFSQKVWTPFYSWDRCLRLFIKNF